MLVAITRHHAAEGAGLPAPLQCRRCGCKERGVNESWSVDPAFPIISGRKAFQKPLAQGVEILNAIQDVYLTDEITVA